MSFNFKQAAIEATTLSELMVDRQKVTTDEIIKHYPEGVTITAFDFVQGKEGDDYPIFLFAESTKSYFSGGVVLKQIAKKWLSAFNDDIAKCNEALAASGGVKIKLENSRTKKGNNLVKATVV